MKLNILFLTLDDIMVLEFIGYSLEESLEDTSIGILEARYEKDAMKLLESKVINLIIADMNINTIESYEFYDKLQESDIYKHIPFVFLSSNEEDHDIAILKGISNFFLKPLDVDQLLETLHNILIVSKKSKLREKITYDYMEDDDLLLDEKFYLNQIDEYTLQIDNLLEKDSSNLTEEIQKLTLHIRESVNKLSLHKEENSYLI